MTFAEIMPVPRKVVLLMTRLMRVTLRPLVTMRRATVIAVALMVVSLRPLLTVTVRAAAPGVLLPDLLLTVVVAARPSAQRQKSTHKIK